MLAITGPHVSRPAEALALLSMATAAVVTVLVPVVYVLLVPAACLVTAAAAPSGHRLVAAATAWFPLSAAALVGTL